MQSRTVGRGLKKGTNKPPGPTVREREKESDKSSKEISVYISSLYDPVPKSVHMSSPCCSSLLFWPQGVG